MKYLFYKYSLRYDKPTETYIGLTEHLASYDRWEIFLKYKFEEENGFRLLNSIGGYNAKNLSVSDVVYSDRFNRSDITSNYKELKDIVFICKIVIRYKGDPHKWGYPCCNFEEYAVASKIIPNILLEKVIGDENQYPKDGAHTDGYYYIRKNKLNNKFLIKQNNDYYLIKSNFYNIGQPIDNTQLQNWYHKYGLDDINTITQSLNNKEFPMSKNENGIWKTDFELDINEVRDNIELVDIDENNKSIKYNCNDYRILDLCDDEFDIRMLKEK
ncbi:hypothetical protein LAV60_07345 [Clostridium sporogenes]|uniref:hypothetical protein n=1 Tax=Clostridium TaxID=1485 RepID=UPI000A549CD8|nr:MULTISPECIES: hypothetical protein [Clostridium]MDU2832710.1 hypothetical protein [Clostridium botulinum]MCW6092989.1 hypothetical protein [Clostridium sporogenes]MDU4546129.1 hypothetical protein [Clostridium botulinum]MDU5012721.1 hypothetical protein [Clostridium botulinum]MDU5118760.1 hypothetical protein [Clostridium botulinum]